MKPLTNKQIIDKLKKFFNGSDTFAHITISGFYILPMQIFLDAFNEYLKTGENRLDKYSELQYIYNDLTDGYDSTEEDISRYEKLIENKDFWNIHYIYDDDELEEIKNLIGIQRRKIESRKQFLATTDYRNTKEYTEWRKAVFERDNYTCQKCGQRGGNLEAHHILRFKDYPDKRYDINNGITLCVACHKKEHSGNKKKGD